MSLPAPITRQRFEVKFLVPQEAHGNLLGALHRILRPVEYFPGHLVRRVTSLYLDRPDVSLAHHAIASPARNEKIRTREYFSHANEDVPSLWIEWKARRDSWSTKARFQLPKDLFRQFLAGTLTLSAVRASQPLGGEYDGVEAFRRVSRCAEGRLHPLFAATYLRRTLALDVPRVRVTLDTQIGYHEVPSMPYADRGVLAPSRLGPEFHREPIAILEVKAGAQLPDDLRNALNGYRRLTVSKFVNGSRSLFDRRPAGKEA